MNRIFYLLLLAVVTFDLGLACAKFGRRPTVLLDRNSIKHEEPEPPAPLTAIALPTADTRNRYDYRFRSESIKEQVAGHGEVTIEYPQLIEPSGRREVAFNRFLEERMRKNFVASSNLRRAEARTREGRKPVIERPLKVTYEVVYADERLVSLKFFHRVAMAGKTDPIDHAETLNYDLAKGRLIKLSELFQPRSKYLLILGAYSQGKLKGEYGDQANVGDGTAPTEANFEHWSLSPEGLVISFDESQFYEPSIGQPVLIVPYEVLWNLIGRQSLIERFMDAC